MISRFLFFIIRCSTFFAVLQVTDFAKQNLQVADARLAGTVDTYTINEKITNTYYLDKVVAGEALDANEQAVLETVAQQCPILGGPGVYAARGILAKYHDVNYNDYAICAQQGVSFRQQKPQPPSKQEELSVKAYPQPAANYCYLTATQALPADAIIDITDMMGRKIESLRIANATTLVSLNTAAWSAGLYVCTIRTEQATLYTTKLSIVK
jgi:Secretion system C-terminal sorting domain